jgi:secondary thiamine-phosphate synthase enzyme
MQTMLELETGGPGLYEVTAEVARVVAGRGDGLLTLLIQHTSASLLIQENADPDVQRDLMGFFRRLVPRGDDPAMRWLTHTLEGADDMPAHIKAALLPVSLAGAGARGAAGSGHVAGHLPGRTSRPSASAPHRVAFRCGSPGRMNPAG